MAPYFTVHKYILRSPQNLKTSLWSSQKTSTLISMHYFIFFFQIATPNPWKASNSSKDSASTSCGRAVNENKLLSSQKARFNPLKTEFKKCRICRTKVHSVGFHFCQECAYKKGICGMCGVKILKTKNYKQSSV